LQNPSQTNGDILNIIRRENRRIFSKKKRESLKDETNELEIDRTKILETYIEA
jgi:hypothetical protein